MHKKTRIASIDMLETIAIFFVMMYHSSLYSFDFLLENKIEYYFIYYFRTLLSTCVPLFFFANGYLLFGREFNLGKHIIKTIKLACVTVLWGSITSVLVPLMEHQQFSIIEIIQSLSNLNEVWLYHLWYMGALGCIYVFFPLLKHVYDTNIKVFYYFVIISFVLTLGNSFANHAVNVCANLVGDNPILLINYNFFNIFNPYRGIYGYSFVYFCVGGIIHHFNERIEMIPTIKRNIISFWGIICSCFGLWVLGIFYSKKMSTMWDVVWNGYDTLFTFFNVIFIYVLCLNWNLDKVYIRTISENTLGIYFIHILVLAVLRTYLLRLELTSFLFSFVSAVFLLVISLVISLVLKKIPIVSQLVR